MARWVIRLTLLFLLWSPLAWVEPYPSQSFRDTLLEGARQQVGKTVGYDGRYRRLSYPGGDVPLETGVCTDVIVRAYRYVGIDLQVLVHEDMQAAFQQYPRSWGQTRPDSNIDHRRVPNLVTFFRRHGRVLPLSNDPTQYQAGDIVTWRLPNGLSHIGLVTEGAAEASPLVVHNIGAGTKIENILFAYDITGHFRYPPDPPASATHY